MRAFVEVVRREILERRLLLVAACVVGVMAFGAALLPWTGGSSPAMVRDAVALVGSVILGGGTLLLVGASIVCREWNEQRLGFYLSRPVGAASLWAGKLTATALLAVASVGLVWLPSALAGSSPWRAVPELLANPTWPTRGAWLVALTTAGLLLTLLAGHFLGVITQLRGLESLIDLTMIAVTGLITVDLLRRFARHGDHDLVIRPATLIAVVVLVAALVAGWAQIRHGGTDARRAHRIFSLVLWAPIVGVLLGIDASSARLTRPTLDQADQLIGVWPMSKDRTAVLTTVEPWGNRPFLIVDPALDRPLRLDDWPRQQHPPTVSPNGRWLVWPSREKKLPYDLFTLDTEAPDLSPRRLGSLSVDTSLALRAGGRPFAVGDERIALYGLLKPSIVLVHPAGDEPSHRVELPFTWTGSQRLHFLDDGRLRLWLWPVAPVALDEARSDENRLLEGLVVLDLDPETSELTEVARLPIHQVLDLSPDHRRLLMIGPDHELAIWSADAKTRLYVVPRRGARQYLPFDHEYLASGERFLADDGFAFLTQTPTERDRQSTLILKLVGPDGSLGPEITLPAWAYLGSEITPGRLLVGIGPRKSTEPAKTWVEWQLSGPISAWSTHVIDLNSGETVQTIDGLVPLPGARQAGSLGSDWLIDGRGWPLRLDPASGETSPIPGFERGAR
ncbi:MAG: hypothetical protein AAGE94_09830 [Acidobacteriota bacterium]